MKCSFSKHTSFCLAALAAGLLSLPGLAQSRKTPILSADTSLNTRYNEYKPVVSPDGQKLFFGRSNHPSSAGGRGDRADAWVAVATTGDLFGNVQRLTSLINSPQADVVVGFTEDGRQLYLMRNDLQSTSKADAGLYLMPADGSGSPKPVSITYFFNKAKHQDITIAPDGQTMLIAMESYITHGLEDLYVSFRQQDGRWSEPMNLGQDINTPMQEMSAFLAADGRTLYFSSNRPGGQGSMDIWVSTRLDNSWKRWSNPQNLGAGINTPGAENYYFAPETGQWSYYTTTQNSEGFGDIRRVRKPETPKAPELEETPEVIVAQVPTEPQSAPIEQPTSPEPVQEAAPLEPAVTLRGQVRGKDGKQAFGKVLVRSIEHSFQDSVSASSSYSIALPEAGQYRLVAKAKGYLPVDTLVQLPNAVTQINFDLRPLTVGSTVRMENVMFQQSTAVLLEQSSTALDQVVQLLRENPGMEIMITGHTDNQGSSKANLKLSQDRVEAVRSYLLSRGIDAKRIQGKGFGGTRPVASNANPETRQLNRRVEFTILKQ
ncbi:OmpA family protein [Cesiribacter andamanensis]|uniref:Inner membrane lipoprotein YiaD n=1 Tax=Cesiribacter andamanensis AMV16 TaxID=1279009 RepID=M7NB05_9BACT|nr:OmpA family protein [Cesiribacter andamanensis]EMR04452.1 Inner membrane lipoprotein YiaD precursor [Cesiribacter andamanensis AMV16]